MTDPYMIGFYVGLTSAVVMELILAKVLIRVMEAKNAKPRPLRTCAECDSEVDEHGIARDSLFKLYVCPTCMDTVPRRFARSDAISVAKLVVPIPRDISPENDHDSTADPLL